MLLQVKDLSIIYGSGAPTVQHVSFDVDAGEVLAIVGESGSGKTTVIRAIQMALPASGRVAGGQILFRNQDLYALPKEKQRAISGKDIAMIFQDAGAMLNPIHTVGRQYRDFLALHGIRDEREATARMEEMFRLVRLDPVQVAASYIHELSGGMRQRIGIAMAVTFHPALLLGDEPTSALDVTTQAAIIRELMDVRKRMGMAIVIVTHNMGVASYMADRILVMKTAPSKNMAARSRSCVIPAPPIRKCCWTRSRNWRIPYEQTTGITQRNPAHGKYLQILSPVPGGTFPGQRPRQRHPAPGRNHGHRRRIGQRQIDPGPYPDADLRRRFGPYPVSRTGSAGPARRGTAPGPALDPDDFQDPAAAFNPKLKIREIICEPLRNFGLLSAENVDAKAREMLRLVDLPEDVADRYPNSLSGGQRQRVGIARAMILQPDIIVCDEATSALDVSVQQTIIQLLKRIQRETGVSYLFICHDLALANMFCDNILIMQKGRIVEDIRDLRHVRTNYGRHLLDSIFSVELGKRKVFDESLFA